MYGRYVGRRFRLCRYVSSASSLVSSGESFADGIDKLGEFIVVHLGKRAINLNLAREKARHHLCKLGGLVFRCRAQRSFALITPDQFKIIKERARDFITLSPSVAAATFSWFECHCIQAASYCAAICFRLLLSP